MNYDTSPTCIPFSTLNYSQMTILTKSICINIIYIQIWHYFILPRIKISGCTFTGLCNNYFILLFKCTYHPWQEVWVIVRVRLIVVLVVRILEVILPNWVTLDCVRDRFPVLCLNKQVLVMLYPVPVEQRPTKNPLLPVWNYTRKIFEKNYKMTENIPTIRENLRLDIIFVQFCLGLKLKKYALHVVKPYML